jgi:ubiquinone biosynthesis protein
MLKIFSIRLYILRILRGISIIYTLLKFFTINWMSVRRSMYVFIPRKYKRNGGVLPMPERLRIMIEKLGPTFVKFGQIVADRPDILSDNLRSELKKLQTMVKPIDHKFAMRLIEDELGGAVEKFFTEIEREQCIGSASIGQVYKGKLLNGEEVVIKIQRPDIETKIELDIQLLKYLAQQLVDEYPGLMAVDIVGFVDEFGEALKSELNYVNEAANVARFNEMFKDISYCKIPKVYLEFSTPRLLVLEYISGVNPDNVFQLIAEGYNPKEIAENGAHILLHMIFKHGFFHADPHAGNLYIQPGNCIALIDFGMVGNLKPSHMQFLAGFTLGLATANARIITESLLTLCSKKFFSEKADMEFYVQDMLNRHGSYTYEQMNFSLILNECVKIMLRYQLRIPANIYLLLKAIATIEKFGAKLAPEISLPAIIKPYAADLIMERFSPASIAHELFDTLNDYISLIRDFPSEVNEILFKLKQGKLIHEIHFGGQSIWGKSAQNTGSILAVVFLIGIMLIGSIIMSVWSNSPWIGNLMFSISFIFAFLLLFRLLFKIKI